MDSAGDFYLDDVTLVQGTVAGVGPNLIQNGGFETGSLAPWAAIGNHSNSVVVSDTKYSGNYALHVISTSAGNSTSATLSNLLASSVVSSSNYTLSFWFLPSTNANNINYHLNSIFRSPQANFPAISLRPSLSSPGSNNPARMLMMAITTSSSINVKARFCCMASVISDTGFPHSVGGKRPL